MSNESLIRLLEHYRITYQLDKLKSLKKELTTYEHSNKKAN